MSGKGYASLDAPKRFLFFSSQNEIVAAQMCAHFENSQNGWVERHFEPHILCIFHAFVSRFTIVRGKLDRILYKYIKYIALL